MILAGRASHFCKIWNLPQIPIAANMEFAIRVYSYNCKMWNLLLGLLVIAKYGFLMVDNISYSLFVTACLFVFHLMGLPFLNMNHTEHSNITI